MQGETLYIIVVGRSDCSLAFASAHSALGQYFSYRRTVLHSRCFVSTLSSDVMCCYYAEGLRS